MSYENAPSTQMLATHCAVCARPLRDAKSVEIGVGPDCRKKYGFDIEIDPEARTEANKIIHALALHNGGQNPNPAYLPGAIAHVRELGLDHLAEVLADRLAPVKISKLENGRIGVDTPYSEEAVNALRNVPGRYFDRTLPRSSGKLGLTTYPDQREVKASLWATLRKLFPGTLVRLPDGKLVIA